ncbi:hypothetical protein A3G55_00160 [Candidatus Giovannonibacteria bacterium RIFCSPLOWO2_12_FULL_44_25]|uniref:RNA polymerase sigma factor n=4 Tax=Parcubacteria group TaxID=1794811 RepID=A0A837INC9_9BACT|nr:MAG: RNA polymerase sigma factor [Parcubacteria group bacterium GW2011_GWC1_44_10]KKT57342.1 MAG: RNA polymerase sigma factor [Candidatus Giovannonibacteria bacterium GW2011_GWB1_44_23]KKT59690.1 MAG: RNA polymerase sigma factor [Candidatus Giovannonibacteria bacterium GW2011_GWA1_44_25]KKU12778.1 MAG: RNA polymerase sigma factor [Candidatus Azambacteria bacterium GW2011_GWC2_45_7b]OGF50067.1 MAG: hypothetical protein A2120_02970 [Candidatus Giovannonibacteria bacterium GWA2_45_15]OGF59098.
MKYALPVHPEEVTKKLFMVLPKRTKDILEQRFGLSKNPRRMTLEAIGQKYSITRERVRQVEADGFNRIRKSPQMQELTVVFTALEEYFEHEGRVLKEEHVLKNLAPHPKHENHVYFLLSLHNPFLRFHENDELCDRWAYGEGAEERAQKSLSHAVEELRKTGHPVEESGLFETLSSSARHITGGEVSNIVLANWLGLSKLIAKNYFGQWGLTEFPEIKPRGVRDLSHMVLVRHGKPLHFSEVASKIGKLVGKPVHTQTVHNELIKDDRFVLVGRGLYALKNWGYAPGVVKDVITEVLKKDGPMAKDKIISAVLRQRIVKPNTVFINLENKKYFKKLADGRYNLK